ncbi:MAG: hypothetical protein KA347_12380, partial [Bacteroidia bacterium]|nr:hypothetical protein [Bacteroidia bacterium]
FVLSVAKVQAQIPVILRVTAAEQADSIGCNFVQELCRITYDAILSGNVKLWNSSNKEFHIIAQSLKEIDASANTSFLNQEVIFIYEMWSNSNKELKSTTSGFLFSNRNSKGEDVEYGYVEYTDLQEFLMRERVVTNANGNFNSNLASFLNSKNYNYQFLQFAGKVINNITDSKKIRDEYIGNQRFNISAFSLNEVPQKLVVWTLDKSTEAPSEKVNHGNELLTAINEYLKNNQEVFFNLGADKLPNFTQKTKWKVTKIEVNELWKRVGGDILYDPLGLIIYINDTPLSEIPYKDLLKLEIKVNNLLLINYIRLKDFNYVIRKINQQEITRSQSYLYQKALIQSPWNKLTYFVENY